MTSSRCGTDDLGLKSTRIAVILNPPAGSLRPFDLLQILPALSILLD